MGKNLKSFGEHSKNENLDLSDVRGSSNFDKDDIKWCEIFDDMQVSPYIDITQVRDCDRIAILSWLSSNFHAPNKRDKQQWD